MNTTRELLLWADPSLVLGRLCTKAEPPRADLIPIAEHLQAIEERSELENALQYIVVSPETTALCTEELRRGARKSWGCDNS